MLWKKIFCNLCGLFYSILKITDGNCVLSENDDRSYMDWRAGNWKRLVPYFYIQLRGGMQFDFYNRNWMQLCCDTLLDVGLLNRWNFSYRYGEFDPFTIFRDAIFSRKISHVISIYSSSTSHKDLQSLTVLIEN